MSKCKSYKCKVWMYKVEDIQITTTGNIKGVGPGCPNIKISDYADQIKDQVKKTKESQLDPVVDHLCPEELSCICLNVKEPDFTGAAKHPKKWKMNFVRKAKTGDGNEKICKYPVKGKYNVYSTIVDGQCHDKDKEDDLGDGLAVAFHYDPKEWAVFADTKKTKKGM